MNKTSFLHPEKSFSLPSLIPAIFHQVLLVQTLESTIHRIRAVFTWLSKGIGFGFGFGFTTPFSRLVYLLWFWFYDSQVKTTLKTKTKPI